MPDLLDQRLRIEAFRYLAELTRGEADVPVRWEDLIDFRFDGERAPLIGQRGIWKPKPAELPVSITTAPRRPGEAAPYDDEIGNDDRLSYRYRGLDPMAHDNVWLRRLKAERRPLIYFHGIDKGVYLAAWPVYIELDDPVGLRVIVNLSPVESRMPSAEAGVVAEEVGRRYIFVATKRRLHQTRFREIVMRAYQRRCAICQLGHEALLDAAHIIPDFREGGASTLGNGLSLCKIHHAAFDRNILGVDPDFVVHVRDDILLEVDGPMLQHGIKEMDGRKLAVVPRHPAHRPDRENLERRFQEFRSA